MKKIYLQKIIQHNMVGYIGKIDPRDLIRVVKKVKAGEVQEDQRPLMKKRLKEIAKYIEEKGILPTTLTLATVDDKFEVHSFDSSKDIYYIEFPETDEEFQKYEETINVMDGQHRLYSFTDEFRIISEHEEYEMGFTLYIQPTLNERKKIFVTCNDKQEKVNGNLLISFKKQLGLLDDEDSEAYNFVETLNNNTPLKGHIIMSAERIKNGIRAKEVMTILKKQEFKEMSVGGRLLNNEEKLNIIRKYLFAWEKVAKFDFQKSGQEAGAAIKIAGLRYMLLILPYIWTRSINERVRIEDFEEFCNKVLGDFISRQGVEQEKFFVESKTWFNSRNLTEDFAKKSILQMEENKEDSFNPFGE
ncbi:MAG: DGQHR domain-containing protein [Elusimicrobiaceae bacterium]|nr:DGQHR domain-containing protein [Elusimicrobiaceae bacterium]